MIRKHLAGKITLLIVVVLIVGFGLSTILTVQREADLLVEQSKVAARRLTDALISSIESAMLQERPDITRALIEEIRSTATLEGLAVYRRNGTEAFTDLSTLEQVDRDAGLPREVVESIRKMRRTPGRTMTGAHFERAVRTIQPQEALEVRDGVTLFSLHRPVRNQEKCQGCHGSDHEVRAVVHVVTSMEPVFKEVRRQRNWQILIAALTIIAAGAVLTVAMGYVVVRPVRRLSQIASRIGAGDFTVRTEAASRDELGQLGRALNDMTAHLAEARDALAARNAELAETLAHLQASRQRVELLEQLKGELAKFVPDAVKELLERNPDATELEKRSEEVSVLFLDIAGYTRLSERMDPGRLNSLVQTYFSSFLEIIRAQHGDVNETAGDGLMVIFQRTRGDHRAVQDHAVNATRAALAIRQRTAALNDEHAGMVPEPVQLHMGINTGEALVGATKLAGASGQRWTFTATGPTTNLAARFAGSAAAGEIVIGPATAERIRSAFVLESLGERPFKNVSTPVAVYRLVPPGVYEKIV